MAELAEQTHGSSTSAGCFDNSHPATDERNCFVTVASKCDVSKEHQVASNVSLLVLVTALEIIVSFVGVDPFLFHQNICCKKPRDKKKRLCIF